MNKILKIFELLLNLWRTLFPPKKKKVKTKKDDIKVIKAALDSVKETPEVVKAKKTIDYIETLPEEEREEKKKEMEEIREVVIKNSQAIPITDKRSKSILDKYKKRRKAK